MGCGDRQPPTVACRIPRMKRDGGQSSPLSVVECLKIAKQALQPAPGPWCFFHSGRKTGPCPGTSDAQGICWQSRSEGLFVKPESSRCGRTSFRSTVNEIVGACIGRPPTAQANRIACEGARQGGPRMGRSLRHGGALSSAIPCFADRVLKPAVAAPLPGMINFVEAGLQARRQPLGDRP